MELNKKTGISNMYLAKELSTEPVSFTTIFRNLGQNVRERNTVQVNFYHS